MTGFPPHLYCCEGLLCCDYTYLHCSLDWKGDGWYRFIGEAGEKMPDSPPGYRSGSIRNILEVSYISLTKVPMSALDF